MPEANEANDVVNEIQRDALEILLDNCEGVVVALREPLSDGTTLVRIFKDRHGELDLCAAKPGDYHGLRTLDDTQPLVCQGPKTVDQMLERIRARRIPL